MSRIYRPSDYGDFYRADSGGSGFAPITAANTARQEQARGNQQIRNLKTQQQGLTRQQQLDTSKLNADWSNAFSQFAADRARNTAQWSTINGLLSLSKTALSTFGDIKMSQMREQEWAKEADKFWGNPDDQPEEPDSPESEARRVSWNSAVRSSVTAVEEVAGDDVGLRSDLMATPREAVATHAAAEQASVDVVQSFPGFMNDYMRGTAQLMDAEGNAFTPASAKNSRQLIHAQQSGLREFYKQYDIGNLDLQTQKRLYKVAQPFRTNQFTMLSREIELAAQDAAAAAASEAMVLALQDPSKTLQATYDQYATSLLASGKYRGKTGVAYNDAFDKILQHVKTLPPVEARKLLTGLKDVSKNLDGNTGLKFGKLKRAEIFQAIDEINRAEIRTASAAQQAKGMQVKQALVDHWMRLENANPDEADVINGETRALLRSIGGYEAIEAIKRLDSKGANYSSFHILDYDARRAAGEVITNDEWREAVTAKSITQEEAKKRGFQPSQEFSLDEKFAGEEGEISLLSTASSIGKKIVDAEIKESVPRNMQDDVRAVMATRHEEAFRDEFLYRFRLWRNSQTDQPSIQEQKDYINQTLLPEFMQVADSFNWSSKSNNFDTSKIEFKHDVVAPVVRTRVINGKPSAVLTDKTPLELSALKASVRPRVDIVYTPDELEQAQRHIRENTQPPKSITEKADAIGSNWERLTRQQAEVYNKPANLTAQPFTTLSTGELVAVPRLRTALIGKESSANFGAINKDSGALGYAQIMPKNLPSWSKDAVGRSVSRREFLRNPALQIKIIDYRILNNIRDLKSAGYEGDELIRAFGSLWYSGNPELRNNTKKQYYGKREYPSIYDYTVDLLDRVRSAQ